MSGRMRKQSLLLSIANNAQIDLHAPSKYFLMMKFWLIIKSLFNYSNYYSTIPNYTLHLKNWTRVW